MENKKVSCGLLKTTDVLAVFMAAQTRLKLGLKSESENARAAGGLEGATAQYLGKVEVSDL